VRELDGRSTYNISEWAVEASQLFAAHRIHFVDCPTSGGPARARGDLRLMVAGDDASFAVAQPVLHCLGRPSEVHVIAGGPGMGSRVKLVHQLLAGVHIAAAAEALSLAAAAGLDVAQVYDILSGGLCGNWMDAVRILYMETTISRIVRLVYQSNFCTTGSLRCGGKKAERYQ